MSVTVIARDASLTSLQVTITALMVSGKQMTLAVFRQLPCADATLQSGELDPSLNWWGLVRYGIKDEGALWAVAERDGKLLRCVVRDAPRPGPLYRESEISYYEGYWQPSKQLEYRARAKEMRRENEAWPPVRDALMASARRLNDLPQLFIAV